MSVTKEGYPTSSSEPRDYVFKSSFQTIKMVARGSGTATVPASSSVDVTIVHSFGFAPMSILYTEPTPGSNRWFMGCAFTNGVENTYVNPNGTYTYVDSTNFKFRITNNTASQKLVDYYYFLMGDSAS